MGTRRSKTLGFIGLLWFLFFVGSAVLSLADPEGLRRYSTYAWSDRDILLCAICYIVVGLAGGIVAARRLVVPVIHRARFPIMLDGSNLTGPMLLAMPIVPAW